MSQQNGLAPVPSMGLKFGIHVMQGIFDAEFTACIEPHGAGLYRIRPAP